MSTSDYHRTTFERLSKVDLPDGGWAALADPAHVTERRRRPFRVAISDNDTATAAGQAAVIDALVICVVDEWSYGNLSIDALQDLRGDVYDALVSACWPLQKALMPDYTLGSPGNPTPPTSS